VASLAIGILGPDAMRRRAGDDLAQEMKTRTEAGAAARGVLPQAKPAPAPLVEVVTEPDRSPTEGAETQAAGEAAPAVKKTAGRSEAPAAGRRDATSIRGVAPAKGLPATGTIKGRVLGEHGEPLAFANVLLVGTNLGAATDRNGRFVISNAPAGEDTLRVLYLGYEEKSLAVRVNAETPHVAKVTLDPAPPVGLAAVVTAAPEELRHYRGGRAWETIPFDISQKQVSSAGATAAKNEPAGTARSRTEAQALPQSRPTAPSPGPRPPISVGGTDPVNGEAYDAMFFQHYGVNPFIDPTEDRFATFAVDVDNASYSLTRSYLLAGNLPPKDAVRVEEFVNSFRHHYPAPGGRLTAGSRPVPSHRGTFAIYLDAAPSPFGGSAKLLRVGLKGREVDPENRKPAILTFVVDVSGSMAREDRLGLVKRALNLLVDRMRSDDEVALVVYGSNARVVLPPTGLGHRERILGAIAALVPEGATNAEAGLLEAYRLADRAYRPGAINRVILCSDGVANVGNTGAEDILARIKTEARRGIELTAVGFGMGNYNDVLMEKLADQGDGNYYYVDDLKEAHRVFVENLTGTLQTIAKDVKIQVEFNPKAVERYRLLGYENRDVADRDFRNDAVDAGEVGAGHEVTALFEVKTRDRTRRGDLATVRIRYADPETGRVTEEARTIRIRDIEKSWNDPDPTFRMDAAAAEFAEILRGSYWAKGGNLASAAGLARAAAREMGNPEDATEMVALIETAARLQPADPKPSRWREEPRDPDRR